MEQWLKTLEYFDYKCAYCGGPYDVIEHFLPVWKAGTTVSNCVPACVLCNIRKGSMTRNLAFYQNERVLRFIASQGVEIRLHIHEYRPVQETYVVLVCDDCGDRMEFPGLDFEDALEYIDMFYKDTGYAYAE